MAKENQIIVNEIESPMDRFVNLIGTDAQLQGMMPAPKVWQAASATPGPTEQRIDKLFEGYKDRPAIGERKYILHRDAESGAMVRRYLPEYMTHSYGKLRDRVRAVASAWRSEPKYAVNRDDLVCIFGFASADYAILDLACAFVQAVSVPLQTASAGADLDEIFRKTAPVAVAATTEDLVIAAGLCTRHDSVRSLIAFDYDPGADYDRTQFEAAQQILETEGAKVSIISLGDLVEVGRKHPFEFLAPHPCGYDRLALILHSSGSTGVPKGAMISEHAFASYWDASKEQVPQVCVVFAPLNHAMGRLLLYMQLRKGSLTYITLKSDMSTLFEDVRLARPTVLSFFPRVVELIHQHFLNEVARSVRLGEEEADARREVMQRMRRTFLGDRLMFGMVASAPTSDEMKQFMIDCFQIDLMESYGATESCAGPVAFDNKINRDIIFDYHLRDVPELGYYTTDKPYPRGELCYKAKFQVMGYYNDPEATAGLLDENGFIISGDIVEERGLDEIFLIDRRKDVIKLSQGEYVAVGPLGAIFESGSAVIHQTYLYGNSHRSYLLAVVVPDEVELKAALGNSPSENEVKELVRDEFRRVAKDHQFKSFEIPRDFIIEHEPFSQENGLLSSIRKRLRPALKRKYGERLEAIYEAHEKALSEELNALKNSDSPLSVLEKLTRLVEIHLGLEQVPADSPHTFYELGGDSLGAVAFSFLIEETFGVVVPADTILSPTGTLQRLAGEIETYRSGARLRPTFESIHGKDARKLDSADLALSRFVGEPFLNASVSLPVADDPPRVVLVTGANGFLGREVCLQWMEKLAPVGGRVICLIRAVDDQTAKQRLANAFAESSEEYLDRFRQFSADYLDVLAGDISQPLLGLDQETFNRVASEVDRICHVAALVNHRLAYAHLFVPNVAGTAEVIRLAATVRKKPIDFVSTIGVLPFLDTSAGDNETALPLASVSLVDEHYAGGYALSKWASEHLLRDAHDQLGIPINILRGPMMLPHQKIPGVINAGDMFTRLLVSLVVTGIVPSTFYQQKTGGKSRAGHYDAIPVDVVAASVLTASSLPGSECRAFNMSNFHHDDGCSLDAFVDWIESDGYELARIEDYREWIELFREKLEALPAEKKQASAIEVLGPFAAPLSVDTEGGIASGQFRDLVHQLQGTKDIPHIDEPYIHKCLGDLRLLGLIGPAPSMRNAS